MSGVEFVLCVPLDSNDGLAGILPACAPKDVFADHARLWTSSATPQVRFPGGSVIVGFAFAHGSSDRVFSLPSNTPSEGNPEKLADWLVHNIWGGYVALLVDPVSLEIQFLVDPSGLCPAFHVRTDTHSIFASCPELIKHALGKPIGVSFDNLHLYLLEPILQKRETCLDGVSEVAPGQIIPIASGNSKGKRLWCPEEFLPRDFKRSRDEVAEELGTVGVTVMAAWAVALGPATVAASGGVDSSFICGALSRARQQFSCITLATADPSGDERAFVHALGKRLGSPVSSMIYDPQTFDPTQTASSGMARPSRKIFMTELDLALANAMTDNGANIVFDGNGGDSLFCYLHSAAPVVDRLLTEGPGRGVVTTFLDMCRLTGCDMPTMLRASLRRLISLPKSDRLPVDTRLLAQRDNGQKTFPLIDWLIANVGRQRGKRDHLLLIMKSLPHLHTLGARNLNRFSPLMSQPLVEFCLSVPTWIWSSGGINRAPARLAFAAELPPAIVTRTSKAGPDSFIRQIFEVHRSTYRELLMDGLLARENVIDRGVVEQAFNEDAYKGSSIIYRLLDLAEAENWARSWSCQR